MLRAWMCCYQNIPFQVVPKHVAVMLLYVATRTLIRTVRVQL